MVIFVSKNQFLLKKLCEAIIPKDIIYCNGNNLVFQASGTFVCDKSEFGNTLKANFSPRLHTNMRRNEHFRDPVIELFIDKKSNKLSIQRDKVGFYHLYFTKLSCGILVSSSLRAIASIKIILGEKNYFSKEGLISYLTFQYIPYTETIIEGLAQVPPGGKLTIDETLNFNIQSVWLHITQREDICHDNILDVVADIKKLFIDSLQKSISGFQHIGCYLSGGMDTSTNVALLVKELGVKPLAFTANFSEPQYSEIADAKIISNNFGLKHFVAMITPPDVFSLSDIVNKFDSPVADRAILPQYFVAKKAKEVNIEAIISGEGGDEVFGYPRRLSDIQGELIVKQQKLSDLFLARYYLGHAGLFNKNEIRSLFGDIGVDNLYGEQLAKIYQTIQLKGSFDKIYLGQWKSWLIDNVLVKDKSVCGPIGVWSANPFIDTRLMELMASFPQLKKLALLRNKNLLRTMMVDYLPEKIIQKKKHKFHVPLAKWFRKPLYEFLHDSLLSTSSTVVGMFEKKFIEQLIREHKYGVRDNNRKLWSLLFLEYWTLSFKKFEKSTTMLKYLNNN